MKGFKYTFTMFTSFKLVDIWGNGPKKIYVWKISFSNNIFANANLDTAATPYFYLCNFIILMNENVKIIVALA